MLGKNEATLRAIIAFQNRIIADGLRLEAVFASIVHDLPKLVPSSHGAVIELRDSDMMVYRAASGTAAHHIGLSLPVEGSLSGLCVLRGALLYAKDCTTDQRVDRKACEWLKIKSMICCPVIVNDLAVGVLKSYSQDLNAFDDWDHEVVRLISEVAAASILHASVHEAADDPGRIDTLTGLGNRRAFDEDLNRFILEARRVNHPLVLAMFDYNGLKKINDAHGVERGDAALANAARVLSSELGAGDRAYRIGGDEFCLILPEMRLDRTDALFHAMLAAAGDIHIAGEPISLAVGAAELSAAESAGDLLARAEAAMTRDKGDRQTT